MKIRIVCYENVNEWILGKFASKLCENLARLNILVDIAKTTTQDADINHHIIYSGFVCQRSTIDTLMVTHIDTLAKKNSLQKSINIADLGICMSNQHMQELVSLGISADRLCYVNPAHDDIITPRPKIVGIASRVYPDGRKREYMVEELLKHISPEYFSFKIMGAGWGSIVNTMQPKGFDVTYYPEFSLETYSDMIQSLDYYLYTGLDEGQIGFIDALTAGVETIVPPIGYHLDASNGITYSFRSMEDLIKVFSHITEERRKLVSSVDNWTWENYATKHLEIWNYLIEKKAGRKYFLPVKHYNDGIYSVAEFKADRTGVVKPPKDIFKQLLVTNVAHKIHYVKTLIHNGEMRSTLKKINYRRLRNFFFKY